MTTCNKEEKLSKLDRAIIFAVKAHSGVYRKSTKIPYITHPIEAVAIASTITDDIDILSATALHDVVEDTPYTLADIEKRFGKKVAKLVAFDSEDKREDKPFTDTWKVRKQETIDKLSNADKEDQIVVLSDKLSNIRCMYRDYMEIGDKLWTRFNQNDKSEHAWYYYSIMEKLNLVSDTAAYRELKALLGLVFHGIVD